MTVAEIRLQCLKLADPDVSNPDVDQWIERARKLEAYVMESGQVSGQSLEPPKKRRRRPPKNSTSVGQLV